MNSRRSFLTNSILIASSFAIAPAIALAEGDKSSDKKPWRTVNVNEDGKRVILFFDFGCPYCAKYHKTMIDWANSVPKQIQTLFVPVVNPNDKARFKELTFAAACYYAAFNIASSDKIGVFIQSVYDQRGDGVALLNKDIWFNAIQAAGINKKQWLAKIKEPVVFDLIRFATLKERQYNLLATPSIAVGGKYVLTPDDVNGDEQMFYNILNGLTSEIL